MEEKRPWDFVFEEVEDLEQENETVYSYTQTDNRKDKVKMQENKTAKQFAQTPFQEDETPSCTSESPNGQRRDFSLRDAVVYSAILERPYK